MNVQTLNEIRRMAEEVSAREGCYLYDIEFVGSSQGRVLRVYIDKDVNKSAAIADGSAEVSSDRSGDSSGDRFAEVSADSLIVDEETGLAAPATGVSIEDCTKVSRGLNELLEALEARKSDVIPEGAYDLEVSTPGLERALKEPRHYERAIGKKILVRTFAPVAEFNETLADKLGKAKQVQGNLLSHDERGLTVDHGGLAVFVPFETITKAHMVFEFTDPSEKPGKAAGKQKKGNKKK